MASVRRVIHPAEPSRCDTKRSNGPRAGLTLGYLGAECLAPPYPATPHSGEGIDLRRLSLHAALERSQETLRSRCIGCLQVANTLNPELTE